MKDIDLKRALCIGQSTRLSQEMHNENGVIMKTLGKVTLERDFKESKNGGNKKVFNLVVKDFDHDGNLKEAKIFCRLTKEMEEFVESEMLLDRINIEIKDSFYSVDTYRKGEKVYHKLTLVITDLVIID